MIWLAVAEEQSRSELEQVLPRLAAIVRFTGDLDGRLREAGLDGLGSAPQLHARDVALMAALAPDVGRARGTVGALVAGLRAMEENLAALRRIKVELARVR